MTENNLIGSVSPRQLHQMLLGDDELALIDVREIQPYSHGHILVAVAVPLPRLELMVADLITRRSAAIIVCDGGDEDVENPDLSLRAARRLKQLGYTNVAVLDGGCSAWKAQGYELFAGMNVPSKAFGEFVEEHEATPSISADELKRMQEAGEDFILLDSRPEQEFNMLALPGGVCCPGGELAYRVYDMAPSPNTTVVVNCAGRTRSIIGCQSLVNAGIPNKVVAVRNGVMGWHLAGYDIAFGLTEMAPPPGAEGLAKAKQSAARLANRFSIKSIDRDTLNQWRDERDERSLYVLDVRTIEEFEEKRPFDAIHAPGGQLVQNTDFYVATRNARLVLVDSESVRAVFAASWLTQMGQKHVYVLDNDWQQEQTTSGERVKPVLGLDDCKFDSISPAELKLLLADSNVQVLDVSLSNEYKKQHIPNAWFVPRARLRAAMEQIPSAATLVLTSSDGIGAQLTAAELESITGTPVKVLSAGNEGWLAAGFDLQSGDGSMSLTPDDQWQIPFFPDPVTGKSAEDNMREYLSWETALFKQIKRDSTTYFQYFPAIEED